MELSNLKSMAEGLWNSLTTMISDLFGGFDLKGLFDFKNIWSTIQDALKGSFLGKLLGLEETGKTSDKTTTPPTTTQNDASAPDEGSAPNTQTDAPKDDEDFGMPDWLKISARNAFNEASAGNGDNNTSPAADADATYVPPRTTLAPTQ